MNKFHISENNPFDAILTAHQHIFNGGYSVVVDAYGGINFRVSNEFADCSIYFCTPDLDSLISVLQEARQRLSEKLLADTIRGNV